LGLIRSAGDVRSRRGHNVRIVLDSRVRIPAVHGDNLAVHAIKEIRDSRRAAIVGLEDIPVRNVWRGASDEPCLFIRSAPSPDPAVLRLRI
jgi:hypothetical protein